MTFWAWSDISDYTMPKAAYHDQVYDPVRDEHILFSNDGV